MIEENTRSAVINDGICFIRSITEYYGAEEGMQLWERIAEVIDPKIKGEIFFAILTGSHGNRVSLSIDPNNPHKIPMIKSLRTVTGFGLKEAKDIVDSLYMGKPYTVTINVDRSVALKELRAGGFRI